MNKSLYSIASMAFAFCLLFGAASLAAPPKKDNSKANSGKKECKTTLHKLKKPYAPQATTVEFSVCSAATEGDSPRRVTGTLRILDEAAGKPSVGQPPAGKTLKLSPCFGKSWEKLSVRLSRKSKAFEVIGSSCTPAWCGYPERLRLKWTKNAIGLVRHYKSARFWEACVEKGRTVSRVVVKKPKPQKTSKKTKPEKEIEQSHDPHEEALSGNHKKFIGSWVLDVDKCIANNEVFRKQEEVFPDRVEKMREMFASWKLKVTKTEMSVTIMGKPKEATYTVESDSDNKLTILSTDDASGKETLLHITFNKDGGIMMRAERGPQMKLYFKRQK